MRHILKEVHSSIEYRSATDFRLQFTPKWIVQKVIERENDPYQKSNPYVETDIPTVPISASLISLHYFFTMWNDGTRGSLSINADWFLTGITTLKKQSLNWLFNSSNYSSLACTILQSCFHFWYFHLWYPLLEAPIQTHKGDLQRSIGKRCTSMGLHESLGGW